MESNKKLRILVAGGAGFIGTHLCTRLIEKGHTVLCVDNLASGSRGNIEKLLNHKKFKFLQHDIIEPIDVEVDTIFNLACCASPRLYQADPLQTLRTNTEGVTHLLRLAQRCNATVFQASTSEIYGDPDVHPQSEDYCGNVNPIGPRACYDEGKRCAETACMEFHRVHGVKVKIARVFNTYGPLMRLDDGRVVSNFIVQALANEPITIFGDGEQTRSFCYVDDLLDGIEALMRSPQRFTGPVNLGNPGEFTVLELAHTILAMTQSRSRIIHHTLPQDDPRKRKPSIELARKVLHWQPKVSLQEGLRHTIDYFDRLLVRSALPLSARAAPLAVGGLPSTAELS